jgi:hypothetical protein
MFRQTRQELRRTVLRTSVLEFYARDISMNRPLLEFRPNRAIQIMSCKLLSKKAGKEFLQKEEGILYAELDMQRCVEGRQYHDVVGGYQRLDVFDLKVDRSRREPATFTERITHITHS